MDKHSFPNGKRLVRDTLKPDDNLHYEKFSDGTVKCIEDEIPFDVPEGWTWARLNDLALYKKGPFGSSITKAMFVPESDNAIKVYEQKNAINKNAHLGHYFISQEKYQELKGFEIFPGDIIVSCAGTIGETFVMPSDMRKGIINQALMKIHLYDNSIKDFYLMYFDNKLKSLANEQGYGMALKNIPPFSVLKQYLIPIPPMAEQEKILERIKITLSNINDIDLLKGKLQSNIANAKSKILDLAIRGKLVPQDPNDEPASVLLERIRAEKDELIKQGKIKRNKKKSVIFKGSDNSYYQDLPSNWIKIRLSTISEIITKGTTPRGGKVAYSQSGIGFLRAENIAGYDKLDLSNLNYVDEESHNNYLKRSILKENDILITIAGTLGRTAIVPQQALPLNTNQAVAIVRLVNNRLINVKYLVYALNSPIIKSDLLAKSVDMAIPNLSLENIADCNISLPPLTEQKRIVDEIEKIFAVLDDIANQVA